MTIIQFYERTLKEAGFTPKPSNIEKIAAEKGVDVKVAMLAKAYFEQMQLDDLPYADEKLRAVDSMKMAEAYFAQVEETKTAAIKTADDILRFLSHAAEGYCAQHQLPFDGREAVKIAGLQAESAQTYEENIKVLGEKIAAGPMPSQSIPQSAPASAPTTSGSNSMIDHKFLPGNVHNLLGVSAADVLPAARQMFGMDFQGPEQVAEHIRTIHHGGSPSAPQSGGSWASRNSGALMAGAAGLGGLYLWHKKNEDEKQERRDRQMSALRAAALPPA